MNPLRFAAPRPRVLALAFVLSCSVLPTVAQERLELGKMWTFENPPLAYLEKEYGFKPTQEWLDSLRLASLRFGNGCSASFVSPKGLVMTNHHCVRGDVARVQGTNDWVRDGFAARSLEEEVKIPGLTVQQLVGMNDVTAEINAEVKEGDDAATGERKRQAKEKKLVEASPPGHNLQVVKLYSGAVTMLYDYKVYDDVRLVCTPNLQTAHFGGDPDNFTYPRYSIDFGFVRAYENDKPADTRTHYFKWSKTGPKENELVFVSGNPGSTGRLLTRAQMDFLRDTQYPLIREMIDNRIAIVRELSAKDPELEKQLRTGLLSLENSQKAYMGYHAGLKDAKLMAQKDEAEKAFRAKVDADPKLAAKYGKCWDTLAEVQARRTALEPRVRFYAPGNLRQLGIAALLLRVARGDKVTLPKREELQVPDATSVPFFADHLERAVKHLAKDDPFVVAALGSKSPKDVAAALGKASRLDQWDVLEALVKGGKAAIEQSDDPVLVLARVLLPLGEKAQKEKAELDAIERVQSSLLGEALFAVYGKNVSPDATFTLRFSDGVTKGFPYNGTQAPWRTSFHGLYARNAEFDDHHPFDLPRIWHERKSAIDLTKAVNFVSTNDIIGGNSGSPVVNKELEVVGLIFDGNIESLPNRFLFTDEIARSVSVHVDAIVESLRKVYEAARVADELEGKSGQQ